MPPADTRSYAFHTLDVFTDRVFGGNPLAVLPDARGLSTEQMRQITAEFNLSETVFVLPPEDRANTCRVRIFTPGRELPFAGHPTVGTAFLLAATGMIPIQPDGDTRIVLEEGVGPVQVVVHAERGSPVSARLSVARLPEVRGDVPTDSDVAGMLSLSRDEIGAAGLSVAAVSCGVPFLLVPLGSRDAVSRARLRRDEWERVLRDAWASEVYLFDGSAHAAPATDRGAPIRARMFAPSLGIGEDPATGSAAAALAGYLALRSNRDAGLQWTVEQGVEMGRPSELELGAEVRGGKVQSVTVGGKAVLVSQGTLRLP